MIESILLSRQVWFIAISLLLLVLGLAYQGFYSRRHKLKRWKRATTKVRSPSRWQPNMGKNWPTSGAPFQITGSLSSTALLTDGLLATSSISRTDSGLKLSYKRSVYRRLSDPLMTSTTTADQNREAV